MKFFFLAIMLFLLIGGVFISRSLFQPSEENKGGENTNGEEQTPVQDADNISEKADQIVVTHPLPNQRVKSPLEIEGQARGSWFFEGSFPIQVLTEDGEEIARGVAVAQGEWMTTDFVPFRVTLDFAAPTLENGTVVLEKDNPSGLPENADALTFPVKFFHPSSPLPQPRAVPMTRADERVTKKPFGILIDPETSPVQPEKFRGYHTGADFETFPEEASIDMPVSALCDGKVLVKRNATGYGGIIVTDCILDGKKVTVVYGHLRLASIEKELGQSVVRGEVLGVLGTGGSVETDGERKHLHVGIHRGETLDIRGYVPTLSETAAWLDPEKYLP